ncbi:MerR family transcriptional regulator [Leucobacter sp. OAMSW11]|uniref:MerR family transcriptional regulator n=1 Tax=unclassified Leucobacter TaxID=2621730 RepID=UPI001179ED67
MTERDDHNERELIRPAEAARISGLTPGGLAAMADRGKLTAPRPGGTHRRYVRAEIEALAAPVGER